MFIDDLIFIGFVKDLWGPIENLFLIERKKNIFKFTKSEGEWNKTICAECY